MSTSFYQSKKLVISILIIAFSILTNFACSRNGEIDKHDFHLYLLAGQSNMAGRGKIAEQDTTTHPRVYVLNQENEWVLAKDSFHFDKPNIVGVGPGLTFGKIMADQNPNVRIGLIPCAAGGSPISSWTRGGCHEQTKSYPYDDAIKRAKIAMKAGVLKGILWHQGESDSKPDKIIVHREKLEELIMNFRKDLAAGDTPFIFGNFKS